MRFTALLMAGAFAVASAQTTMSTPMSEAATSDAAMPSSTVPPSPQDMCIQACPTTDVNCKAACNNVPSPNNSQVNATTSCVAACPQGDGSKGDTERYTACQNKCIQEHYIGSAGSAQATNGAAGGMGGGGSSASDGAPGATPTDGSSHSATGAASGDSSDSSAGASGESPSATGGAGGSGRSRDGASQSTSTSAGLAPAVTAAPAAVLSLALVVLAL